MAQNDVMQVGIKFVLDTNGMDAIVKQVEGKFQNIQLHLKGENIKIDGLEATFKKVQELLDQVERKFREMGNIGVGGNLKETFDNLTGAIEKVVTAVNSLEAQITALSANMSTSIGKAVADNINNIAEAAKKASQALGELDKEAGKSSKATPKADVKEYNEEIKRLTKLYNDLKKVRSDALSNNTDKKLFKSSEGYQELERSMQLLKEYLALVRQAKSEGTALGEVTAKFDRFAVKGNEAETIQRLSQAQNSATITSRQLAEEQHRMSQAMQTAIDKASQQSRVLGDLKSMAAQYLSIWGASSFVKEVAQITGELELQERSLSVIIGSAGKAQELFNDIKGMSQMSPYTFQDLLKTTRQLSAFGIETKDLYGTMKALSDIGAGLDVDVQRLVLAYGHIKSSGVLTGIQRRQLETAGIGITAELSKMYNEQYRQAGSSERVSTEDVFKRIRDRQVSFEDVEKVFNRLTGPGGKFYEMQLKQYDTLGGKLRNLKNNYNIMLDEIGKSYMDFLMGGVDAMNNMMKNWREWKAIIVDVVAALAAAKVAQIALGKSFAAHSAANAAQLASARERLVIHNVNQGNLFGRYSPNLRTPQLGTSYAREILDNKDLSRFQKIQSALYANVSKDAGNLILKEQGLNEKYQNRIAAMKKMANSTKPARAAFGRLQLGFERLDWSARNFFNTMKTGFASLMANPMLWIGAAIAGITSIIQKVNELKEQERNITKNIKETSASDIKSIEQELEPLKNTIRLTDESGKFDGRAGKFIIDREKFSKEDPTNIIKTLDEQLQKYDPLYKGTLFDLNAMQDEADKAEAMINRLDIIAKAKQKVSDTAGAMAAANKESGGVFSDTFLKEAKELEDEYLKVSNFIDAHEEELEAYMRKTYYKVRDDSYSSPDIKNKYKDLFENMGSMDFGEALKKNVLKGTEWHVLVDADIELNTHDLSTKVEALKKKATPILAQLKKNIRELKAEDETGELRASYLEQMLDSLLSQGDTSLSDPKYVDWVKGQIMNMLDTAFLDISPQAAEEFRKNVLDRLASAQVKAEAGKFFEQEKSLGNITPEMTPEQIEALKERFKKQVYDAMIDGVSDPREKERLKRAFDGVLETAIKSFTGEGLKGWQRDIKKALNLISFDDIKIKLGIDVTSESDISKVITETRKKFDECKKIVTETFGTTLKSVLNITIDPAMSFGSVAALESLRKQIYDNFSKKMFTKDGAFLKFNSEAAEVAKEVLSYIDTMISLFKVKDATGLDTVGPNKDAEKANKAAERAAEKARKAQKAEEQRREAEERRQWNLRLRNLGDQISMINEVRSEYNKWAKDLSKETALEMVEKNLTERGLYGVGKLFEPGDLKDVTTFSTVLARVEEQLNNLKATTKDPDRLDQIDAKLKDVAKVASDNAYLVFSEASEKYLLETGRALEDLSRKWERYNSVLEKTGDTMDAIRLSGLDKADSKKTNFYADDLEQYIETMAAKPLGTTTGAMRTIDPKKVAKLDDKGIEDYAKNLIGKFNIDETGKKTLDNAQQVQGLIKALKEYKRVITDLDKRSVDAFNNASASAVDYKSQIKRVNAEIKEQQSLIARLEGISKEEKLLLSGRLDTQKAWAEHEKSNDYSMMMNNNAGMSTQDFLAVFEKTRKLLLERLEKGLITPAEYTKSSEELYSKRSEYREQRLSGFMNLDPLNRMERAFKEAMTEFQKASAKYEEAQSEFNDVSIRLSELEGLRTRAVNLSKEADKYEQLAKEAEEAGDHNSAIGFQAKADKIRAEAEDVKVQANNANLEIHNLRVQQSNLQSKVNETRKDMKKAKEKTDNASNSINTEKKFRDGVDKVIKYLNLFSEAVDFTSEVLKSFGVDSAAMEDASTVAKSTAEGASVVGGISSALGAAGPYGAAAGAVLGLVSGLFQIHDAALQRQIEDIKFNTEKMKNTLELIKSLRERELGYDGGDLRRELTARYRKTYAVELAQIQRLREQFGTGFRGLFRLSPQAQMYEYYNRYSEGSGYQQELELLKQQRQSVMQMYSLEDEKKSSSQEELENYKKQIAELDEQIMFYVEDLAKELWGIDLKGWSEQLSDALMTAFENGESAAGAFRDTVQDIMRSMVQNMLTIGVIEPAFDNLRQKLFGEDGTGGLFDPNNAKGSVGAVIAELGNWFKNEGPALMDAANEFYNGADDMMRQTLGYGLRSNESSSSAVTSISSVASEETMGVVAGYLSRMSQDVSVQRIMQEMFVNGSWPSYIEQVTSANDSLTAIDRSTTAMMEMMRDGNGALYERVENMSQRLDNFANGIDRITIN